MPRHEAKFSSEKAAAEPGAPGYFLTTRHDLQGNVTPLARPGRAAFGPLPRSAGRRSERNVGATGRPD